MRYAIITIAIALACTGCSTKRTPPAQIMNSGADLPLVTNPGADIPHALLPNNPLAWRVVTSGSNRAQHTMYTLYGNDSAIDHARSHAPGDYPAGAQLALVTWTTKEDPHWFGGYIPSAPQSVEYVTFDTSAPKYTRFNGAPLARDTATPDPARAAAIANMRAALMP
jgi:hypothetical protein